MSLSSLPGTLSGSLFPRAMLANARGTHTNMTQRRVFSRSLSTVVRPIASGLSSSPASLWTTSKRFHSDSCSSSCSTEKPVRVRYAPSPTGSLHLGGLRTALYNYVFARQNKGKCLLRIEDTDRTRLVHGAVEQLFRDLDWCSLSFDEGPAPLSGDVGPYTQSERYPIYLEHVHRLVDQGHAYHCFCTPERLDALRANQSSSGGVTVYDRLCSTLTKEEVASRLEAGTPNVIRMRIPEGTTSVHDAIRGEVIFQNKVVDDQVLLKSDGFPTYHLANIVDDHLMGITHVIRGEEWLPSAVKHVLLYRMFGWEAPVFAHLPLLMREDGSKLSKRFRDSSLDFYIERGYLPEAILNFVALLGWHPTDAQLRAINGIDTNETAASDAPASSSSSSVPSTASTSAPIDIDADAALLRAALAPTESKKKKAAKKASPAAAAAEKSSSALLGESLSEVFTIEDMTGIFDISRVQKGGAAVEMNKLNFYQSQYWRKALEADPTRLAAYVTPKVMSLLDRLATGALTEDDITALGGVQYASISADVRQQDPCHGVGTAAHAAALKTTLSGAGSDFVAHPAVLRALKTTRDHPCKVSEFPHLAMFAWARPQLDSAHADTLKEKVWVSVEAAAVTASSSKPRKPSSAVLEAAAAHIEAEFPSSMFDSHDVAGIVSSFKQLVKAQGVGLRDLYLPMRFALSGSTEGPGVADQMCALGKEETLARIKLCLEQCK